MRKIVVSLNYLTPFLLAEASNSESYDQAVPTSLLVTTASIFLVSLLLGELF